MFQIKNEIDKLIAYAGDREEITQADIDAVASGEVQDKIFDLVDAIARKNQTMPLLKPPESHALPFAKMNSSLGDMEKKCWKNASKNASR